MNKDEQIATAVGIAFVAGVMYGTYTTRTKVAKELRARSSMIAKGLTSAVSKARNENLTTEEFERELQLELKFMEMAVKA